MALVGNYSLLHKSFARTICGAVAAGNRSNWNTNGGLRNWGKQTGLDWSLTALPQGFGAGGAWMLPKTAGGMTSRREARLSLSATGTGAEGYGIAGTATISLDAAGIGGLIAGGVGSATISIDGVGSVTATIGTTGSATLSLSGSANIGALGWIVGESQITLSGTLTPYARGHMVGTTEESGLTVAGITNSVWNAVLADYPTSGTAGNALGLASSGGVDYSALAAAVWSSISRTLTAGSAPTTAEIVAAIEAAIVAVNVKQINDEPIIGDGRSTEFHT